MCIAQAASGVKAMKEKVLLDQLPESQRSIADRVVAALLKRVKEGRIAAATGAPCLALFIQAATEALTNHRVANAHQQSIPASPAGVQQQQQTLNTMQEGFSTCGYNAWCIIAELELYIQTTMQHGRCSDAPDCTLYSSTVLKELLQDRARLKQLSAMTTSELIHSLNEAVKQFGCLLPRYNNSSFAGLLHITERCWLTLHHLECSSQTCCFSNDQTCHKLYLQHGTW